MGTLAWWHERRRDLAAALRPPFPPAAPDEQLGEPGYWPALTVEQIAPDHPAYVDPERRRSRPAGAHRRPAWYSRRSRRRAGAAGGRAA